MFITMSLVGVLLRILFWLDDLFTNEGTNLKVTQKNIIMEKAFYGVSMGLINPSGKSFTQNYSAQILKLLIEEFAKVEAELLMLLNNDEEVLTNDEIDRLLAQGYFIFSFEGEAYYSDIQKTCELVVEGVARKLLNCSKQFKGEEERARVIEDFKICFKPYCTEKVLAVSLSKEEVFNELSINIMELTSRGRGIPVTTKPSMVSLLSEPGLLGIST